MLDHYDQICFDDYRTMKGLETLTEEQYVCTLARPGAMSPSALLKTIRAGARVTKRDRAVEEYQRALAAALKAAAELQRAARGRAEQNYWRGVWFDLEQLIHD